MVYLIEHCLNYEQCSWAVGDGRHSDLAADGHCAEALAVGHKGLEDVVEHWWESAVGQLKCVVKHIPGSVEQGLTAGHVNCLAVVELKPVAAVEYICVAAVDKD